MMQALLAHATDVKHFGPRILTRFARKPDARGWWQIETCYGTFQVRRQDSDIAILRQVFIAREYDLNKFPHGRLVQGRYEDILAAGKIPVIVDGGANVGFAATFFAQTFPKARIIAIEPDPANAELCRINTSGLPQIQVREVAIGGEVGFVAVNQGGNSSAAWTERAQRGIAVTTVDEISSEIPDGELLIVKIDIEGFEADLFAHNTGWIKHTFALIVEPHDWLYPGQGKSQSMRKALAECDHDLLISGENLVWIASGKSGDPAPDTNSL